MIRPGDTFDLSQPGLENRDQVYEADSWEQRRRHSQFSPSARSSPSGSQRMPFDHVRAGAAQHLQAGSYQLSDGRMTMVLLPWRIADFLGTEIERPAPDHLGFEVESIKTP